MKKVSLLSVFSDLNGRVIYCPYDQFDDPTEKLTINTEKYRR